MVRCAKDLENTHLLVQSCDYFATNQRQFFHEYVVIADISIERKSLDNDLFLKFVSESSLPSKHSTLIYSGLLPERQGSYI